MNPDEFDPTAVMLACLEDIWNLPPVEAAESVSARVSKLDRASRMSVLEAILDEAEGGNFWAILSRGGQILNFHTRGRIC